MKDLLLILLLAGSLVNGAYTPMLVQLVHRHGARTPFDNLPGVINKNTQWNCSFAGLQQVDLGPSRTPIAFTGRLYRKVWIPGAQILPGNCSQGVLTDQGARMLQNLGEYLRERYISSGFLPETFSAPVIRVRSTDVSRTFHSVENLLKTFYPARNIGQGIAEVIAVNTIEKGMDYAAPDLAPACDALKSRCSAIEHSPEFQAHLAKGAAMRQQLMNQFNVPSVPALFLVMDTLRCLEAHNQPIVVPQELYEGIQSFASKSLAMLYSDTTVHRLGIGTLLDEMVRNIVSHGAQSEPRFYIFSAHDTTVGLLLGAMQIDIEMWPVFAANLLLEYVRDENGKLFVQVLYDREPVVLKGQSSSYCPLNDFIKLVTPALVGKASRAQECAAAGPHANPKDNMVNFLC